MPPILHPRSRHTSTLFTSTLALCFLVVGAPHLLPCPVDRRQYADSDGELQPRKKRRRIAPPTEDDTSPGKASAATQETAPTTTRNTSAHNPKERRVESEEGDEKQSWAAEAWRSGVEKGGNVCPVPKPRGWLGKMMGFGQDTVAGKAPEVVIAPRRGRAAAEEQGAQGKVEGKMKGKS